MTTWSIVLLAIAVIAITSHAFLLMCYAVSCYRAWKRAVGADGFLRIAGRDALATVVFSLLSGLTLASFIPIMIMFGLSPELAQELSLFRGLVSYAVTTTFALPLLLIGWDFLVIIPVVLLAFFVLGLITMLPGLGYGSGRVWGAAGLAAYAAYMGIFATYLFPRMTAEQDLFVPGAILVVVCLLLAAGAMWICLIVWSRLARSNTPTGLSPAPSTSPS